MSFDQPEGLKHSRSQNFLTDRAVLRAEAQALEPEGRSVLEIGGGDGRLSQYVHALKPASLTIVELDPKWAAYLRARFHKRAGVSVLEQDVLELPDTLQVERVVGNIPYQITSPILVKLARWGGWARAVLCMQKEVAERLSAPPGSSEYGRLSAFAQTHFLLEPLRPVPRTSFHPPPKVDSMVVLLTPRPHAAPLPAHLEAVSAALFSHRRVSVANALLHSRRLWGWSKEQARAAAQTLKWRERKVFTLSWDELAELAAALPAPL